MAVTTWLWPDYILIVAAFADAVSLPPSYLSRYGLDGDVVLLPHDQHSVPLHHHLAVDGQAGGVWVGLFHEGGGQVDDLVGADEHLRGTGYQHLVYKQSRSAHQLRPRRYAVIVLLQPTAIA
jgi:hypothetical protein